MVKIANIDLAIGLQNYRTLTFAPFPRLLHPSLLHRSPPIFARMDNLSFHIKQSFTISSTKPHNSSKGTNPAAVTPPAPEPNPGITPDDAPNTDTLDPAGDPKVSTTSKVVKAAEAAKASKESKQQKLPDPTGAAANPTSKPSKSAPDNIPAPENPPPVEDQKQKAVLSHKMKIAYFVRKKLHNFIDNIDLEETTRLIAIPSGGDDGVLYKLRTGEMYWTNFHHQYWPQVFLKLNSERNRPLDVSLGTYGRYYMKFAKGNKLWSGPEKMAKFMAKDSNVSMVAFGEKYDSYFILFENGSFEYNDIPEELKTPIEGLTLEFVSLGSRGQWCFRANGKVKTGGLCKDALEYFKEIEAEGDIREVAFTQTGCIIIYVSE